MVTFKLQARDLQPQNGNARFGPFGWEKMDESIIYRLSVLHVPTEIRQWKVQHCLVRWKVNETNTHVKQMENANVVTHFSNVPLWTARDHTDSCPVMADCRQLSLLSRCTAAPKWRRMHAGAKCVCDRCAAAVHRWQSFPAYLCARPRARASPAVLVAINPFRNRGRFACFFCLIYFLWPHTYS